MMKTSKKNYFSHLLLLFCLIFPLKNKLNAQYSFKELRESYKTKPFDEKSTDSILNSIKKDTAFYVMIMYRYSRVFAENSNYKLASKYADKQIKILENLQFKLDTKHYHNGIYQLAKSFFFNKEYYKAIKNFKKASNLNIYPKKSAQSLCWLARCYRVIGDYEKSINYHIKGINLLKKYSREGEIIIQSLNLSLTCINSKKLKNKLLAINYLKSVDSLILNNYKEQPDLLTVYDQVYNFLGIIYNSKELYDFNKAKYFYQKALKESSINKDSLNTSMFYSNLGELYLKEKNDSAIYFFNKSNLFSNTLNKNSKNYYLRENLIPLIAENLKQTSKYYSNKLELKTALNFIQKSNRIILRLENDETFEKIKYDKLTRKRKIINGLKVQIELLIKLNIKEKNPFFLNSLSENVIIADNLIKSILTNNENINESKFLWREDVSQIYFMGSYAAHLLGNQELVFNYQEKNKAFLLAQSVNENNYKIHLPNHVINEDLKFRKEILNLEADLEKENDSKKLKDSLFTLKFNYQNFNDSIQELYPDYFENKNKVKQVGLDEVQKKLDKNTIVVSYTNNYTYYDDFHTEENKKAIIGLVISKDKTISFKIDDAQKIINNSNQFRQFITKPLKDKEGLTKFKEVSYDLYDQLFPTEEIKNLIKGKKLIIIPDNELQNIPFEAFNTNNQDLTYLVESNDISYANSMSFLNINKNIYRKQDKDFVGFAPINFNNTNLNSLLYSEKEINAIDRLLSTESYTNEKASKENFLETSENAKIIHLATHANVSNNPVIHFNKDSLQLHELYTYKNNADLVVLSACETNLGEIKKGEGVLSLARGFFYSGSNAVISSLWKVNDATSSTIITDFYKNLKNNQTKSAALNNAKRNYLKNHSLSEKSPYYWASFVLIGDTSPTFNANYTLYYIILSIIVISGILFFFKKRG